MKHSTTNRFIATTCDQTIRLTNLLGLTKSGQTVPSKRGMAATNMVSSIRIQCGGLMGIRQGPEGRGLAIGAAAIVKLNPRPRPQEFRFAP